MLSDLMNEMQAIQQYMDRPDKPYPAACACMGPQGDEPLCHCAMKYTEKVNGILYEIKEDEKGNYSAERVQLDKRLKFTS